MPYFVGDTITGANCTHIHWHWQSAAAPAQRGLVTQIESLCVIVAIVIHYVSH